MRIYNATTKSTLVDMGQRQGEGEDRSRKI